MPLITLESSEPDQCRFIIALFNLSKKNSTTKVSREALLDKLKGTKSKFNKILVHWLQSGFVEADASSLWLTNQGIAAVEQYRSRKEH